uniref:Uncharacterized protein n=1 Tax=Daphnia galeata TaxID=27404 RepID=A0A8J2RNX8_9CRUS|nr:unnamed protein product [Daphnia galeata]
MSPLVSSRLMATCWLTLAVFVVGLWCHPVPDKNNNTNASALSPALKKVDDLGQLNDFADYPDMVTDFLRLSTTKPTVAASTKASVVTTPSTQSPSTTIRTTIKTTTAKSPSTSGITKAFEIATAKFFPSVAPTVMTTTEGIPITAVLPDAGALVPQKLSPVVATPQPFIEKLQKTNKPAALNEIEPLTKPTVAVQTTAKPPIPSVAQQQQKLIPDPETLTQQPPIIQNPVIEQQQPTAAFSGSIKQQAVPAVQRQPVAVFNQPQQQQMAVSGAASIQQHQPTNLVQTTASSAPRQQQQQQNFAPQVVPISAQQQPMMQNPAKMQPQPPMIPMMPNPAQSAVQQQQMMLQNPAMMQQMMMRNPVFQQQQFQMMLQNRPQVQAKATSTVRPGVKQPATPVMTLINNSMFGNNRRPVFFLGGNGNPTNILPISALPQLLSGPPPVATAATRPV